VRETQQAIITFCLFLFFEEAALAHSDREVPKVPARPPVAAVVTASRVPQPLEVLSSSTTVITKEDIAREKAQTVTEVLRNVPGLHLNKFGGPGRQVNVFTRGANTNHTLVMIDGVQVNSPTSGDFDFSKLTTENIERIEVIRGPQSTLHGSDAVAGVINIITEKGSEKPRLESWSEYGTLRTFYEGQTFSGSWKGYSLSTSWSRLDTDGLGENDELEDTSASTKFDAKLSDKADFDFLYRYSNGLVGIDDGAFRQDPNRFSKARQNVLASILTHRPVEGWEQKLKFSFFHDMLLSVDPPNAGTTERESRFKLDTNVYTLDWQHDLALGEHDIFTLGYEFEHARSDNKTFNKILRNHGWYFQNLLELWDRLYLTAGIRFEENQAFGFDANPKFGLAYLHRETGTKFKANFGTAFRAPTLNQLFFPNFGNPTLQPEESVGFDFGLEQGLLSEKVSFGATYFYNYFDELIQSVPQPGGGSLAENVGKSRSRGVELEGTLRPFAHVELKAFYTFLEAETIRDREPLIRRPKHSGGLTFHWKLTERVDWNVNLSVLDERYDSTFATGRPRRELAPNFAKLDTTITVALNKHVEFYTRIENLNEEDDDEVLGFDSPGAQFFGGMRVRLG
jgi:vitamin B12 transporter